MNCSAYIFGVLSSGYTQYPDDGSSHVFSKLYPLCKAPTQVIVHRDDNLMYYCYVRKLSGNKYIGMAVVINGYYVTTLGNVFKTFETAVEKMVSQGSIIHFAPNGSVIPSISKLNDTDAEANTIIEALKTRVETYWTAVPLPPVNYAEAKDSKRDFASTDNHQEKVRATYTYGYTILYKEKDYDTVHVTGYRAVLSQLKHQNDNLTAENEKLKEENARVKRQKKQVTWVILLLIGVVGCSVGLYYLNENLSHTKGNLEDANYKIEYLNDTIRGLNTDISNRDNYIQTLQSEISTLEKKVALLPPLTITDVEFANTYSDRTIETNYGERIYSNRSMYITPKITYDGNNAGEIELYFKIFKSDGTLSKGTSSPSWYTYSNTMTVVARTGETQTFTGWGNATKGHWSAGTYRFEIWYSSKCIWSGFFTVYSPSFFN